jgi:hypothetical protein
MPGIRPVSPLPTWLPWSKGVRDSRPPRAYAWQYALLSVLLLGLFLVATVVPHFGTLWHTHEHGREEHTHTHLFTTPEAHTHDHPVGLHTHHHEDEDTEQVSSPSQRMRISTGMPLPILSPLALLTHCGFFSSCVPFFWWSPALFRIGHASSFAPLQEPRLADPIGV